jgi:hypothetical protein
MATQSNKLHQNNKIPKDTNNKQYHKWHKPKLEV